MKFNVPKSIFINTMIKRNLFSCLCLTLALFSVAGIRKNEDPIAKTAQTEAVSLKQRIEETKDGAKGAPSPSMAFYGDKQILTDSPVSEETFFEDDKLPSATSQTDEASPEDEYFESDDAWEAEDGFDGDFEEEKGQESTEKAVEDEDDWWSEE